MTGPIKRTAKSFSHALNGIKIIFRRERSFQLQTIAAMIVVLMVILLELEIWQRVLLILLTSAVLVLEILNSIFERISDALRPRLDPVVKDIKDMMAGAVLFTSITAAIIALLILWEYVLIFVDRVF